MQPPEDTADVLSVIDGVIKYEEDAIKTYRSLIEAAKESDDPVTEDLAISILSDEESHRSEFRSFRNGYNQANKMLSDQYAFISLYRVRLLSA